MKATTAQLNRALKLAADALSAGKSIQLDAPRHVGQSTSLLYVRISDPDRSDDESRTFTMVNEYGCII